MVTHVQRGYPVRMVQDTDHTTDGIRDADDDRPVDDDSYWAIVCDGTEDGPDVKFLSVTQEWSTIETAMLFATEQEAVNGAETLCPPFTVGHAQAVDPVG
jgi:hypothetical protein